MYTVLSFLAELVCSSILDKLLAASESHFGKFTSLIILTHLLILVSVA